MIKIQNLIYLEVYVKLQFVFKLYFCFFPSFFLKHFLIVELYTFMDTKDTIFKFYILQFYDKYRKIKYNSLQINYKLPFVYDIVSNIAI